MKKRFLALSLAAVLALSLAACGSKPSGDSADEYPAKAITVVVPFSAGGEHDLTARTIAARMKEMFDWTITIQNTTGDSAATIDYMRGDNSDGYTLLMNSPEVMASGLVSGQLDEPYYQDMIYLGNFVYDPLTICVSADSPYNSLEELFDAAKESDGNINWACVGAGGKNEMDAQNLWDIAGVSFNYVPYDDASKSRAAVLGNHATVYQSYASGAKTSVDAGELKVLAVGADERLDFWPEVPTLKELGYDVTVGLTRCWDIHPDTPQEIVDILTEKLEECVADPETQAQLQEMGQSPDWMTNEEMHEYGEYYFDVYTEIFQRLNAE